MSFETLIQEKCKIKNKTIRIALAEFFGEISKKMELLIKNYDISQLFVFFHQNSGLFCFFLENFY